MHVLPIRPQIDNRIADDLARSVVGDVAAAAGFLTAMPSSDRRSGVATTLERPPSPLTPTVITPGCSRKQHIGNAIGAALLDERALHPSASG